MRVLMTADTVGGVWTYALELIRALGGHRTETILATMGAPLSIAQRDEVSGIPRLSLCESEYKLAWMTDPWDDIRAAGRWLLELERRYEPDVVHLNDYAHGDLRWRSPVLVVGHSCVLSWWLAVHGAEVPADWHRYREAVTNGLRAASLVVAPTHAMMDALERHYGPLPPAVVIPNGREPALFPPRRKEPFVITVGRVWDEAKNATAVGDIAAELAWPVVVAGETRHPNGQVAAIPNVHALGMVEQGELARWLGRASIYALPARYEPFGLSALEAGLAGCALVLGDIPSLREIWGDAAVYVPPEDRAALLDAIEQLIGDIGLRRTMAMRARTRALRHSPQVMMARYLEAYGRLAPHARMAGTEAVSCAS